ncbi:hypothetical protein Dsin_016154 [Dipteronia sinensis]|uniref:GH18 domain-containing protein n=1 Tax=Dipteronia sinensis TaxID=43782 RepID=A0AAE0E6N8_9ROSI|nr:hypothetical protein Dsin_016154 [Dipteronia sinensis]
MAGSKFMSIFVLVIIVFTFVENCDSFSIKIPPNLLELNRFRLKVSSKHVPTSLSYDVVPGPNSSVAKSINSTSPANDCRPTGSPVPATPSYIPGPSPDPYPAIPASPRTEVPAPEGQVPTLSPSLSPQVPGPDVYGPVPSSQGVGAPEFYSTPQMSVSPAVSVAPVFYGQIPPIIKVPVPAPDFFGSVPTSPDWSYSPIVAPPEPVSAPNRRSRGIKAAYWPSFDGFPAASINTSYFTHIYYAFLLPEPETFKLNLTQFDQTKIPEFIDTLRTQNPPVKTLLSIGGGGNDPTVFSRMVSTDETRAIFIKSTIEIARRYGFDGVDLDWEFPADDQDMSNLALLYSQWRKALKFEAKTSQKPRLLLTSAVYFSSKLTDGETRMYPIEAINNYVDWVSPMCFDYHGSWENFTGVHAALYGNISTSRGLGSWIQDGVRPRKLVMGLPLYGHTWKLQDPNVNGIGAPALGVGPGGGILIYSQIMEFNSGNRAVSRFDIGTASYYSYSGDSWVGYDDVVSVQLKIVYAKLHGLGGYFFWALGQDQNWTLSKQASYTWGR